MEGLEGMEGSSELLLSLAYNAITGRLTVDVLQGTNLKYLTTNRPPGQIYLPSGHNKKHDSVYTHACIRCRKFACGCMFDERLFPLESESYTP